MKKSQIWKSHSNIEGSCNFCSRYVTPRGLNPHDVFVIESPGPIGIRVRFCKRCAKQFRIATRES